MKFLLVTICAIVVAASSTPIEELVERCAVCNNYFAYLTTGDTKYELSAFSIFEQRGSFEKLCAACNTEDEVSEENYLPSDLLSGKQEDEEEFADVNDLTILPSLTNCQTCAAVIDFTAHHTLDFSEKAISTALSHACSSHKIKNLDDIRCRLFVNIRKKKIIKAIFKHHLDSVSTCLELNQC